MTAAPVRIIAESDEERRQRFIDEANHAANCIASREVAGRARFSERHRQSLAAWQRGERSSPWPDPTPEEQAAADEAVRGLLGGLS